jgi:hypothetical protein
MLLDERDTVSTTLVAIVANVVDAPREEIHAETGLAGAIEGRRGYHRGIEGISEMMQPDRDMIRKRLSFTHQSVIKMTFLLYVTTSGAIAGE